ncbi:MAG: EcsC family protein [SAR324 cluster bacterium]|nr:EcsC family protein [SAR324 cluster bacterium]
MNKEKLEIKINNTLEWAYEKALDPGVPLLDSAEDLAQKHIKEGGTLESRVNSFIRWQNAKTAANGFVGGVSGLLLLPVVIPANTACILFIQIRMIAAIAIMAEHDVKDEKVKTLIFACLCGNAIKDLFIDFGIQVGVKFTQQMIKKTPLAVFKEVNKAVGFRLVTKFGEKGGIGLVRAVPIAGGIVGGVTDAMVTNVIGKVAKEVFI